MKILKPPTIPAWLDTLRSQGRLCFSKAEAEEAYGARVSGLPMALHRLLKARRIVKPKHGFYIILDPPYRKAGSVPGEWIIDPLMKHLGIPYYVGGLSAAGLYGGTHQAVQELQVVIPGRFKGLRTFTCGRLRIHPLRSSAFDKAVTQQAKSSAGYYQAASPEMAAWDLVAFMASFGGIDQIGTALRDMAGSLDAERLVRLVKGQADAANACRLGWLLEHTGSAKLAAGLRPKDPAGMPWRNLVPGPYVKKGAPRSLPWHLVINHRLDLDL